MRNLILRHKNICILMIFCITACTEKVVKMESESEKNKVLYTMGQVAAKKIDYMHLTENEYKYFALGANDWVLNHESKVNYDQYRPQVQRFIEKRYETIAIQEKKKGEDFIELYKKKGGGISSTGLGFRILENGNNLRISPSSKVLVNYTGKFIDGEVFDTTDEKGAQSFALQNVISGWKEGLELIGEGGRIELIVPPKLAYGDRGSRPAIPPGATLIFDIELIKILKN